MTFIERDNSFQPKRQHLQPLLASQSTQGVDFEAVLDAVLCPGWDGDIKMGGPLPMGRVLGARGPLYQHHYIRAQATFSCILLLCAL